MSKILLLYPDVPSKTKAAGHKSAFRMIEELCLLGHHVYLVTFASTSILESDRIRLDEICKTLYILPISAKEKLINCFVNPLFPALIGSRISREFTQILNSLLPRCDIVHIEFSQMLYYVRYIKMNYPDKKIFFYSHDIIEQKGYREALSSFFLNAFKTWDYLLTRWREKQLMKYADKVIVFNKKDRNLLKLIGKEISIIPLYTDVLVSDFKILDGEKNSIAFFGAMNRKENYLAALEFIKQCWPVIHAAYPSLELQIIGGNPHSSLMSYNGTKNICVTGFIENPYELIAKAWVTVAPITLGAGLKVKVLESLMSGCPVVAFPAGAEGIDMEREEGLITVLNYQNMAEEIIRIVSGRNKYNASKIKKSVSEKFNWQESVQFLQENY
jgi:glycosyltransferase involved in cell wall biosynthesis